MMQLIRALRRERHRDDVIVVFDTKGDFMREFYEDGDAIVSNQPDAQSGGAIWNLFGTSS